MFFPDDITECQILQQCHAQIIGEATEMRLYRKRCQHPGHKKCDENILKEINSKESWLLGSEKGDFTFCGRVMSREKQACRDKGKAGGQDRPRVTMLGRLKSSSAGTSESEIYKSMNRYCDQRNMTWAIRGRRQIHN